MTWTRSRESRAEPEAWVTRKDLPTVSLCPPGPSPKGSTAFKHIKLRTPKASTVSVVPCFLNCGSQPHSFGGQNLSNSERLLNPGPKINSKNPKHNESKLFLHHLCVPHYALLCGLVPHIWHVHTALLKHVYICVDGTGYMHVGQKSTLDIAPQKLSTWNY